MKLACVVVQGHDAQGQGEAGRALGVRPGLRSAAAANTDPPQQPTVPESGSSCPRTQGAGQGVKGQARTAKELFLSCGWRGFQP